MTMSSLLGFLGNLHFGEILVIVLIVLLLFGSAKIPALMKSMGSGINQFKKGLKEGEKEADEEKKADAAKSEAKPAEPEKK
jgi:sec-independent protein translocase protein TatA